MSLLIFNLIIFPFIFSQLILEYKKEIKRDLKTPDEIMLDLIETEYYTNIKIGTPFQNLKINIEFTKNLFYISGDEKYKKYNPTISSSYKLYSPNEIIKDFDLNIKGILSNETIYLNNNKKYENFLFVLSGNSTNKYKMFSSSIGLGIPSKYYMKKSINFINNLFLKKEIDSYSFFINQKNENEGEIIIGNLPHELNKNKFKKFEVSYSDIISIYNYWNSLFDYITYNNITYHKNYMVLIDFNLEGLIIEQNYFYFYKNDFFQYYIDKKICFERIIGNYNYFYCDKSQKENIKFEKLSKIFFKSKNFNETFIFDHKDLFKEKGDYIYFLAIHDRNFSSIFVLGKIVFNKYQLGFNYDRRMIYLYKNDLNESNKSKNYFFIIFIIILLVFVLLVLIYYYVFYCKIKRKIYAIELEDDTKLSEKIL